MLIMEPSDQLLRLFEQWRLLTEAEGEAIRISAWWKVGECQDAKCHLQNEIVLANDRLQNESPRGAWTKHENEVREAVGKLILLESRNGEWLAEQRRLADAQSHQLQQSERNLRQIHKAYAPQRSVSWQSYS
jgi:hypothetical protein